MARPIKKGLDYFPFDIDWKKGALEYLYCMYGILGVAVIKLSLEPRIYGGEGYFVEYNERSSLIFSNEFGDQLSVIDTRDKKRPEIYDEIIRSAIEYGIFDKEMYKKYGILTSADIQETYVRAKEKSQRVEMERRYLLLSDVKIPKNVELIGVYGEETPVSSPENSTKESKVKKSIVNKSKVKQRKESEPTAAADRILSEYERLIGIPTHNIADLIEGYLKEGMTPELIIRLIEYSAERNARNWQYIEKAIIGNLNDGVLTLDDYNRRRADRQKSYENQNNKKPQKSRFNNYEDVNVNAYADLEDILLEDMLKGAKT